VQLRMILKITIAVPLLGCVMPHVRYWPVADMSHCTAQVCFRGKADMTIGTCLLSQSLSGVKRTSLLALQMSAYDPKRTLRASIVPARGCNL
jgi:hypothetical protein